MKRYPHQLSGGMLQRCVIAMALMTNPSLLIMDEPTTALDVTTQAVVLDLVAELKREFDSAILYITHDLGVITKICDRVGVMYAGEFMEQAELQRALQAPAAPLHARPARLRAALRPHAAEALAGDDPGLDPSRRPAAAGLHLRAPLRLRRGGLHAGATAARGGRGRRTSPRAGAGQVVPPPAEYLRERDRGRARGPGRVRARRRCSSTPTTPRSTSRRPRASSAPSTAWTSRCASARRSASSARAAAARRRSRAPSSA